MTQPSSALSRRQFLRATSVAGAAATAAFTNTGLLHAQAAGQRVAAQSPASVALDENLLARDPAGLHARSHDHQPQQRRLLPEPARRPRGAEALSRHLEPGAGVPHVADPRAEHRERCGGGSRLDFGCDPEELAITRNASEALQIAQLGHRPEARRRGRHDQPGLRPDARHLGAARPARRHHAHEDLVPGAAAVAWTISPID